MYALQGDYKMLRIDSVSRTDVDDTAFGFIQIKEFLREKPKGSSIVVLRPLEVRPMFGN